MKLAYTAPDGRVSVVVAAAKADLERVLGPLTDGQYEQHVIERSIPAGVTYHRLPDNWTPPDDRTFRDAWRLGTSSTPFVDMPVAREIHMARIRRARDKKMVALDREWMKHATQRPNDANAIEAQRQVLRDLPQTFKLDGATTPAELKALWPAVLA